MQKLSGLTGLRFLAAFYVILFHIQMRIGTPFLPKFLTDFISQGALGVNVFFTLSGFILTYSHMKNTESIRLPNLPRYVKFMIKRFARIYPAYLAGLLIYSIIKFYFKEFTPYFFVITGMSFSMLQSLIPPFAMEWYGSMAWSVSDEIFFYMAFPFALPLILQIKKRNKLFLLLALAIIASYLPGFVFNLDSTSKSFVAFNWVYTSPLLRFPEFLCGMITSILYFKFGWRINEWITLLLLMVPGCYLAILGKSPRLQAYVVHNLVILPAIIGLIVVLVNAKKTIFFKWVGSKLMVYLGEISYSFYIVQIPIMLVLDKFLHLYPHYASSRSLWPAIFFLNLLCAALLHRTVETWAYRKLQSLLFMPAISSAKY